MARVRAKRLADMAAGAGTLAEVAARAWSMAVARAAQDELGLPLDLREVTVDRRVLAEVAELLPDPALIAVLDDGAGQGTGFAVLDPALTAGMVEAVTTGRVEPGGGGAVRRPTRTDAAMLSPVLDRALAGFEQALAGVDGGASVARGYRFATLVDGARALLLLLEEGPFRLLRARALLADGAREGVLMLGLPDRTDLEPARLSAPVDDRFATDLAAQVGAAPARLEAVLLRLSLPLGEMLALAPDQEIALPRADIARITLEGLDGRRVATGRLGRQGGLRAIRLHAPDEEGPG